MGTVVIDGRILVGAPNGFRRFAGRLKDSMNRVTLHRPEWWSVIGWPDTTRVSPFARWGGALDDRQATVYHDLTNAQDLKWIGQFPQHCRLVVTLHDLIPCPCQAKRGPG